MQDQTGMLCTPMDCICHTMQLLLQLAFNVWVLISFPVSFGFVGLWCSGFYLVLFLKKKKGKKSLYLSKNPKKFM